MIVEAIALRLGVPVDVPLKDALIDLGSLCNTGEQKSSGYNLEPPEAQRLRGVQFFQKVRGMRALER